MRYLNLHLIKKIINFAKNMSRIQDIHALEKNYSALEEYLSEQDCYTNPVFAIWHHCGKISVVIDDPEKQKLTKDA